MVQSATTSQIEELHPGLTFQWIFDQQGIAFYAENSTRGLVDAWAEKVIESGKTWPIDRPFLVLNDFSGKDCAVTPYNQQRNREMLKLYPHLRIITAVVVKQSLAMHMTRLFIRVIPKSRADIHLGFNRNEAVTWLKKYVDR